METFQKRRLPFQRGRILYPLRENLPAYDTNLMKLTLDTLSYRSQYAAGVTVEGGGALFAGGRAITEDGSSAAYTEKVTAYDENLSMIPSPSLQTPGEYIGANIGNFALFGLAYSDLSTGYDKFEVITLI